MSFDSFFSRVDTGHVFLCSLFRHPSVGCITCECSSLPHSLLRLSSCGFSFLSGLFSLWLPAPRVNPVASLVTLLYSFRLTQTSTSGTALIYVVCLCFVSHISLHFVCLTAYNSSVMALFGSAAGAHGEVMLSPITR